MAPTQNVDKAQAAVNQMGSRGLSTNDDDDDEDGDNDDDK